MYCVNSDALVIFWTGSEDREKFFNELRPNQSIRGSRDLRSLFALTCLIIKWLLFCHEFLIAGLRC